MEHTENSVEENKTSTPDATKSSGIKIAVIIILVALVAIAIKLKINRSDNSDSTNSSKTAIANQNGKVENYTTLNLMDVSYNNYLTHTIQSGQKVKVLLTNDYCPIWTSGNVDMYQDDNSKRVICGTKIIQGPASTPSQSYFFDNASNESVVIKVGRSQQVETFNFN